MITLGNSQISMEFDEEAEDPKAGFTSFKMLLPFFYLAVWTNLEVSSTDYYTLLVNGVEYGISGLIWTIQSEMVDSVNLFGDADTLGNTARPVVKIKTTDELNIGLGRNVVEQEIWYFLSLDGLSVVKRIFLTFDSPSSSSDYIQSIKILNFIGFHLKPYSTGHKLRFDATTYYFGKKQLGFNYNTLGAYNFDWNTDAGLTVSIGRNSVYPNLLPAFDPAAWVDLPDVYSNSILNLKSGDNTYVAHFNAFPDSRKHWLHFSAQGLTGPLQVSFSLVRNIKDADGNAQISNITEDGNYVVEFPEGFGYTWLYVRFNQVSGDSTVLNPYVQYRDLSFTYVAPDDSQSANTNLMNCIRVQSSSPNTKRIYRNLDSNLFISNGYGIGLSILSLDNTDIQDGAFKVIFQKPDNTWVSSADFNMFIDYNEKYNVVGAEQFNLWDDGLFGVKIPDGVDEIKAIGIEFVTTQAVDWLLDGLFVLCWQSEDKGTGSDDRRNFGPGVDGLRARDFCFRGVNGISTTLGSTVKMEPVPTQPGVYRLNGGASDAFGSVTSIEEVYYIIEVLRSVVYSAIEDRGYEAVIDMSGISGYFYPVEVRNSATDEKWRIKSAIGSDIIVDISDKERLSNSDLIVVTYKSKVDIPASGNWELWGNRSIMFLDPGMLVYSEAGIKTVYVDYTMDHTRTFGLQHISSTSDVTTVRIWRYNPLEGSSLLANYNYAILFDAENTKCSTSFMYRVTNTSIGPALFVQAQEAQDALDSFALRSRKEPIDQTPRNYNLIPHIGFGGEEIAANPIGYITETKQRFDEAGTANAIVSAGSLSYLRDRDMETWWFWGGSLHDTGIDYLKAERDMLRSGLSETEVADQVSRYRYFLEVTTFAYEHNKRHRAHASVDYKGVEKFKRVWYYHEPDGLYTSRVHDWDDFQDSYYDSIEEGEKTYVFQYHYTLVIPAFWSIVTSKDDWGLSEDTIYDLMKRRIDYLCGRYDCEGIIISELIHYREGFSDNDFSLYDAWCQDNEFGAQADWPRFGSNQYVDPDDEDKVWAWKRYQVKKYLTEMATAVHGHGKLLGVNVNVQNVIGIVNQHNPVWSNYTFEFNPDYHSWHVNTLEKSLDRYGTNYIELLKEGICDFLWVWLYYKYSPFGKQTVYNFISYFNDYKERMILTIGLFPKENPPGSCDVVALIRQLLIAGWNVCYAGYPPMLIQDERWKDVWPQLKGYVPGVQHTSEVEEHRSKFTIDPARSIEVPFFTRF